MKHLFTIAFVICFLSSVAQVDTIIRPNRAATPRTDSPRHFTVDTGGRPVKRVIVADTSGSATPPKPVVNLRPITDSLRVAAVKDSLRRDSLLQDSLKRTTLADSAKKASVQKAAKPPPPGMPGIPRAHDTKSDLLFYILAGITLFMGIIKVAYPRYFQNTFRFLFQTSLRQKQTPEQIVQGYIPGFLLNLLFFMVGGVAIALFGVQQNFLTGPLWLLILFCTGVLAGIYLVKYLVTLFAGWVFNARDAAGMYSFIVFLINRFIGILLLPLVVVIAFYNNETQVVMFTIAAGALLFLLVYRYILSLTIVRKNLKVSALHFFIYLCAVEIMPLLVIYKVLFK